MLLPAAAWGEKDGTVTNSDRRISRQRAFLPLPGDARPDWWIVSEVARRLGFGEAFAYRSAADVFREHAALSAFENDGARVFDLGGLATFPTTTTTRSSRCNGRCAPASPAARRGCFPHGGFPTPDRKARFVAPEPPALREPTSAEFPLRLNTGRLRDQWHSMTRSGKSPKLGAHQPEPFLEIHPLDAKAYGLAQDGFARVRSRHGACVLKVVALRRLSSEDRCSRRSIGATPMPPSPASAIWWRRTPIRFPASPRPRPRRSRSSRSTFAYRGLALARTRAPVAGGHVVGAGRASRSVRLAVRQQRRADGVA